MTAAPSPAPAPASLCCRRRCRAWGWRRRPAAPPRWRPPVLAWCRLVAALFLAAFVLGTSRPCTPTRRARRPACPGPAAALSLIRPPPPPPPPRRRCGARVARALRGWVSLRRLSAAPPPPPLARPRGRPRPSRGRRRLCRLFIAHARARP
ncbi:MAG: hypothetical protein J3K34DRAFT_63082 [Monoraphidium minutum]|nr:MAG: hypothetical protein J3K34DRAFT_63082 [Monoraphidium minutum]